MKVINQTKARFWLRNNKGKLIIAGLLVFCLAAYYVLHQNLGYGSRASERRNVLNIGIGSTTNSSTNINSGSVNKSRGSTDPKINKDSVDWSGTFNDYKYEQKYKNSSNTN